MRLSAFTATVVFTFITATMAVLYAPAGHTISICSEVAHEIQESWQRGEISEGEARTIIESCLDWEDKQ